MNKKVFNFFQQNYAPGRICLVGSTDLIYELIRLGQSSITPNGKPSQWNHAFLMGERRGGKIFILESDIHISFKHFQFMNGPQESRLEKWCMDSIENACVLGMDLGTSEQKAMLEKGLAICYDDRYTYPVGELFGTLWAMITKTLHKKNIFDEKYAIQCSTFVRMCYQSVQRDPLPGSSDHLSNTSPERLYQSKAYSFRKEWHKSE